MISYLGSTKALSFQTNEEDSFVTPDFHLCNLYAAILSLIATSVGYLIISPSRVDYKNGSLSHADAGSTLPLYLAIDHLSYHTFEITTYTVLRFIFCPFQLISLSHPMHISP